MRIVPLVALLLVAGSACVVGAAQPAVQGSGKVVEQPRTVGDFGAVRLEGAADLEISVGGKPAVTVIADDNVADLITTRVDSGTLFIANDRPYRSRAGVKVRIVAPALSALEVRGSGDSIVTGVSGERFDVAVLGSGDVTAKGAADTIAVQIKGSGDVDLGDVTAGSADVSVFGSGDVRVNASSTLKARIMGSGDVVYRGQPQVERSVFGSGDIHPE